MSDLRERIARACEAEVDTIRSRRDDPGFDERTQVYLDGYLAGSLQAARIARETPVAREPADPPIPPDHLRDAYRAVAARLWAALHAVDEPGIAFEVVDGQARTLAGELADGPEGINPR